MKLQAEIADKIVDIKNTTNETPKVNTATTIVNGETEPTELLNEGVHSIIHEIDGQTYKGKSNNMTNEESKSKTEFINELTTGKENTTNGKSSESDDFEKLTEGDDEVKVIKL